MHVLCMVIFGVFFNVCLFDGPVNSRNTFVHSDFADGMRVNLGEFFALDFVYVFVFMFIFFGSRNSRFWTFDCM